MSENYNSKPLVSIITVCFNSEKTIANTIKSIKDQTYKNIEYIIIDGKSEDRTIDIIHSYNDIISKIISEKDDGIYDAFNIQNVNRCWPLPMNKLFKIIHFNMTFVYFQQAVACFHSTVSNIAPLFVNF